MLVHAFVEPRLAWFSFETLRFDLKADQQAKIEHLVHKEVP